MPTIPVSSTSGVIRSFVNGTTSANFTTARDGNSLFVDLSDNDDLILCGRFGSRIFFFRGYYAFDTSSITSTVSSATLDINVNTYDDGSGSSVVGIIVKGTEPGSGGNLTTSDWLSAPGMTAAQSGQSYDSTATKYSNPFTLTSAGAASISFNATALGDMLNDSVFNIVLMEHSFDFTNNVPGSSFARGRFDVDGRTGTSPLVLNYTLAPTAAGEVASVNNTAIGNISSILGAAKASIASINGVDMP